MIQRLARAMATALLVACSRGGSGGTASSADPPSGWVADVVDHPEQFTALMDATGRDGWVAFHANDLLGAAAAFDTPGANPEATRRARARVEAELAAMHGDLARLASAATERFMQASESRSPLPVGSPGFTVAALAARCASKPDTWSPRAPEADRAVLEAMGGGFAPAALADRLHATALEARMATHATARTGSIAFLLGLAGEPMLVEPVQGYTRKWWDPCVHHTLADAWARKAGESLGPEGYRGWVHGLEGRLFAPWPSAEALVEALDAGVPANLLGAEALPGANDDVEAARDLARRIDTDRDAWKAALLSRASDDGAALVRDLAVVDTWRHARLVRLARRALLDGRPVQGGVFAQRAVDVADPGIGSANSPAVYALLAEANLRQGRTREALDSLARLAEPYPEVVGLRESIGDLAVLEGLDRQGDSKEN